MRDQKSGQPVTSRENVARQPVWLSRGLATIGVGALLLWVATFASAGIQDPLEPADTSSPRATLESFREFTREYARNYAEFRNFPDSDTQNALVQLTQKTRRLFDLSEVPPAAQSKVAEQTFLFLWEVIARLELPQPETIPGAPAGQPDPTAAELTDKWRIPRTEITIARVTEGEHAGEFLFSPETVEQADSFYEAVRDLPYRRKPLVANVHRLNQLVAGWMIPMTWVESLPDWANASIFGQVAWKWIALLVLSGITTVIIFAVFRLGRRNDWDGSLRVYLSYLAAPLAILLLAPLLSAVAERQINVTGAMADVPAYFVEIALSLATLWVIWLGTKWVPEAIIASPRISSVSAGSIDANLIRLTGRFVGIVALLVLLFRFLQNIGVPVYGLAAGAGVGGVGVALAARTSMENFLGTLNLYADRPVQVGDFCRYGEDPSAGWLRIGTIEEVGLRSTRIRGIDRTITTIPNGEFCNMHIVNLTLRDRMLLQKKISLRYETTPDQLRLVLAELREMLLAHPRITEDPARVRAIGFGPYSLDLDMFAYVRTRDWNDFLSIQEDVVLRIMKIVHSAGTAFAVPARIVYNTRDLALDDERRQGAEKQVREWAAAQVLPFPDFADDYRQQIIDTLYYPPEGSTGADRG